MEEVYNINFETNKSFDFERENEILDLRNYIKNFVYCNWKYIDFTVINEDIILENEDDADEYINDEEIFYKGILYI